MKKMIQRFLLPVGLAAVVVALTGLATGFSTGQKGFSGNPATNGGETCNLCHGGGIAPSVTVNGPVQVAPGATVTYEMVISGGQAVAAGLNVSATDGELAIVPGATDTQLLLEDQFTNRNEVTHTLPKLVDGAGQVVFTWQWTAPADAGFETLYGVGNSVNLASGFGGDKATATVFGVLVGDAPVSLYMPSVVRP